MVAGLSLAATIALSPATLARQQGEAAAEKPPVQTMLVVERAAIRDFLPDAKDAALVKAIGMVPDRLRDLRRQVPELAQVPEEALELLLSVIDKPARIAVTNKGFDQQTGMPGIGAIVSFGMSDGDGEKEATQMHQRIEHARGLAGMPFQPEPSRRFPGMSDLPLPVGVLSYGPRKATDGWRYEFIFAAIDDPDTAFKDLPPHREGVSTAMRGRVDVAAWSPIIQMFAGFAAMASPGGQQVMDQFRNMGLLGPDAVSADWSMGHTASNVESEFTVRGLGKFAENLSMPRNGIEPAELWVIPADATFVAVKKSSLKTQWEGLKKQMGASPEAQESMATTLREIESMTGVNLETEFFPALGDTVVSYFSESTGGSSLFSGVMLVALADAPKMAGVMKKLSAAANRALKEQVPLPAAVEFATFDDAGVQWTQLRFPGLPVPLEPSMAVAGSWLVIGATPQAATFAARQIMNGKASSSIASNDVFTKARWDLPVGAKPMSITFIDAASTMRDGYSSMSLLGSLMANLARTPSDALKIREPGMVLPSYGELKAGAKPMLAMSYWSGEDYVMAWKGDRSILVSMAGIFGVGDVMPLVTGLVIGSGIGAQAAEQAGAGRAWSPDEDWEDMDEIPADEDAPAEPRQTPY